MEKQKTLKKLFVFDFDGTLTTADTLLEFIRFACGRSRMLLGFALYSPLLVLMKLRLYPNYKAKQKVFAHFFKGMPLSEFDRLCTDFARQGESLLRPAARHFIDEVRGEADGMAIVSASVDNWVRPFTEQYLGRQRDGSPILVLGTRVETGSDGRLTGRFATPNCYGPEKVRRIEAVWPDRAGLDVSAFGDSRGDKEMLAYADQGYFKPFRF